MRKQYAVLSFYITFFFTISGLLLDLSSPKSFSAPLVGNEMSKIYRLYAFSVG